MHGPRRESGGMPPPPNFFQSQVLKWCIVTASGANFQGFYIKNKIEQFFFSILSALRWDKTTRRHKSALSGKRCQYISVLRLQACFSLVLTSG